MVHFVLYKQTQQNRRVRKRKRERERKKRIQTVLDCANE